MRADELAAAAALEEERLAALLRMMLDEGSLALDRRTMELRLS